MSAVKSRNDGLSENLTNILPAATIGTSDAIDRTDYLFLTQWPRFRVKHLLEFVHIRTEIQLFIEP